MRFKKILGVAIVVGTFAVVTSCGPGGTDSGGILPAPSVNYEVTNSGADVFLTWGAVDGADGYVVRCDGQTLYTGQDTFYTIQGTQNVCKNVEVRATSGTDEGDPAILDFSMTSFQLTIYRTDDPNVNNPSWVKIVFDSNNPSADAITQGQVDVTAPNTGYFVWDTPNTLKDVAQTSINQNASYELAFTGNTADVLAPPTGNYNTVQNIADNDRLIFWADFVNSPQYGAMDQGDYFGVIQVGTINGTQTTVTIYIQTEPGLRWVKE